MAQWKGFNPTMVRLLQEWRLLERKWQECFNPTMVRLLRYGSPINSRCNFSFNPTMVRLLLNCVLPAQP